MYSTHEPYPSGTTMAVTVLSTMYTSPPKRMEMTMMVLVFLGENLNSSAACGMVSKPTKAQGATATTARIPPIPPEAPVVFS